MEKAGTLPEEVISYAFFAIFFFPLQIQTLNAQISKNQLSF